MISMLLPSLVSTAKNPQHTDPISYNKLTQFRVPVGHNQLLHIFGMAWQTLQIYSSKAFTKLPYVSDSALSTKLRRVTRVGIVIQK